MKSLLLALALSVGCYIPDGHVDPDYAFCRDTIYETSICEQYYVWVPGYYSWPGDHWHRGHYVPRRSWRHPAPYPAPRIHDHRWRRW